MKQRSSRLRRQLLDLLEQHQDQLQGLLEERGPLIRGSFGIRSRKCGNPRCRCARGRGHKSKYLTATDGGKTRQVHVPLGDESLVAEGVSRYRRFARGRKRLAWLLRFQLALVEDLKRSLIRPYPADNPLPPASRRGRKPQGDRRDPH